MKNCLHQNKKVESSKRFPLKWILATFFMICFLGHIEAQTPPITNPSDGWVKLYDDKSFKDRVLTIEVGDDAANLNNVTSDNGKHGFGDKTSSVRYKIPVGWKLVLFDDHDYKDSTYELRGTGYLVEVPDLGSFSDKTSSYRWERE